MNKLQNRLTKKLLQRQATLKPSQTTSQGSQGGSQRTGASVA